MAIGNLISRPGAFGILKSVIAAHPAVAAGALAATGITAMAVTFLNLWNDYQKTKRRKRNGYTEGSSIYGTLKHAENQFDDKRGGMLRKNSSLIGQILT